MERERCLSFPATPDHKRTTHAATSAAGFSCGFLFS
jgi:hypothetical protein